MNNEIKKIINDEEHYRESNYPITIITIFSTFQDRTSTSNIELSTQGSIITFSPDDSIRDLLLFNKTAFYEDYNISHNPVDILSFDNFFFECDIAQGMIFKGRRNGILHNLSLDGDLAYKYIENFRGGFQWHMM